MINRLANWLILSWGWKRQGVLLLSGAASALAMPPYGWFGVLLITLPVLAWTLESFASERFVARLWRGFLAGWVFGFGYHLAGLYWIGNAFFVDGDQFLWALPLAILAMPIGLALFHGVCLALFVAFWPSGPLRVLALAGGLTLTDMVRSYAFTGFPWNSIGYALGNIEIYLQTASLIGLFGLGFVTVFALSLPAVIWPRQDAGSGLKLFLAVMILATSAGLGGYGWQRLQDNPTEYEDDVVLRLVQPNIPQIEKWKPENRIDIIRTYLDLTDMATSPTVSGVGDVTHVIWPESALPLLLLESQPLMAQIAALLPDETLLLTGNNRRDETGFYNSLLVIDGLGRLLSVYDKNHLVPFGEYMPLSDLMTKIGLEQISQLKIGFTKGQSATEILVPGLGQVRPLICFEAIFPRLSATQGLRPKLLLNVTNDAWFGFSSGPYQHFAQARMRAVEQGIPLVRAANTGISAVVDPLGRVLQRLDMGQKGVIDSLLPKTSAITTFARFHHWPAFVMILLSFLICFGQIGRVRIGS